MKNSILKVIFFLQILILIPNLSKASHIVGGEMTYRCLGNNQYEIMLTIFRDCENGNPGAYFDNPAVLGIFDPVTRAYLRTEYLYFSYTDDTLDLSLSNPCYVVPPNVCIHTTTYRKIISLPYRNNGYHLAYQRCCRNMIIDNIVNPAGTGATYDVIITGTALATCNSSPRFREWPPFYLCAGTSINYDNSAFDPNGDIIRYELCNPYDGAAMGDPAPDPPSNPPYYSVTWQFPYSMNNMMGGTDPFRIDPITGMLSGTPPNTGTFVVGICAKEYRNGVLIGITKRDFQYSVGICSKSVDANFAANIPPCNNSLSILHINASTTISNTYNWNFGDGSPNSSATSPMHTYPDTGTYTVMLVADPGSPCTDTTYRQIRVNLNGVRVLAPFQPACLGDTVQITATNAFPNYSNFLSYSWSPPSAILSGQGTSTISVIANSNINLNLSVLNDKGCTGTIQTGVQIQLVEAMFDTIDLECNTSLALPFINQSTLTSGGYYWDFDGTGTSTVFEPTHNFPDTGTYTVTLVAGYGGLCQDTFVQDIYIPLDGADIFSTAPAQACLGDTLTLNVVNVLTNYNNISGYTWSPAGAILSGQGTDEVVVVADTSIIFTVTAVNNNGCTDTVYAEIEILQINAEFDSINLICNKSLIVPFHNNSVDTSLSFLWDFGGIGTSTLINPVYTFPDTGYYMVQLVGGIGTPCPDTFLQNVYVPMDGAEIIASDTQIVCRGDTVSLTAENMMTMYNEIINYTWTPSANIITGQGTDSVTALANADIHFNVVGLNDRGCRDTAIAYVNVTYISPALVILAIPDSIFLGQSSQIYATNFLEYIYDWTPDTTLSAYDIHNPIATPRQTTTYYLQVTNQYCTHNDSVTIIIRQPICDNPVVFVPNAFSPDGDGHNDVLMVNGNNINQMNMAIYNRWGQKIFETNDQNIGWDGTFNGQPLPPDVYGYYMQCTCDDGGKLFLKGNITLLK